MDKKLYIACIKENFDFLDFWEKHGPPAGEAVDRLDNKEGNPDPATWTPDTWAAYEALQAFATGARRFGIGTGAVDFWRSGLKILDPANKDTLPDYLPIDFIAQTPAIKQIETDKAGPFEAEIILAKVDPPAPHERDIRVDLSKKKSEILNDLKKFLDQVYEYRTGDDVPDKWKDHYAQWTPDESRAGKPWQQLQVWRMRKERIPFSEIAKGLKITPDAAKRAFYKAYEITQGRAYEPDRYRKDGQKINTWDMTRTCQTCPDRQTCSELCPEILRFADQDHTGRKEALDDSGITDFKQHEKWQKRKMAKKRALLNY